MVSKSLLIAYIAFDGSLLKPGVFGGGDDGVLGVRNISGFLGQPGNYQLRVGGPVLTALNTPVQVDNDWSRLIGNTRVVVELFASDLGPLTYNLVQVDANTYNLKTYAGGSLTDIAVQFSVETLASF